MERRLRVPETSGSARSGACLRTGLLVALAVLITLGSRTEGRASDCGFELAFVHPGKRGAKHRVWGNKNALFFTAPMAVNTDGAPSSYHPDDPYGSEGKAINTICNVASALLPSGERINYTQCPRLVAAFREARASGWRDPTKPRMRFFGVAAKDHTPCLISSGPFAGYFVSTTALAADPTKGRCDPARYLNALDIPFAIYPGAKSFTRRGVGVKDVVVYFNPRNGAIDYGIVGDRGPSTGLAEGSVALAKSLKRSSNNPRTRRDTYRFALRRVHALILPRERLEPPYTAGNVRSRARERFEAWGGRARFDDCVQKLGPR